MSRFGIKGGGNVKAGNIYGGIIGVTTDASGNGSSSVTLQQPMPSTQYGVGMGFVQSGGTAITTGVLSVLGATKTGFVIEVRGANDTSSAVKVGYTVVEGASAY
jgi:hypothetical protein